MDDLAVLAAARAITGVIKAFELHADANPEDAADLREQADDFRSTRDGLLSGTGLSLEDAKDGGDVSDWGGALLRLTSGNSEWHWEPSRDPWAPYS